MIEIKIPKEIKDYKSKLFFNLTFRQLFCTGLALGICVPLYIFGRKFINEELVSWLVILIAAPLVLMGFFKLNGMNFEEFAKEWINFNFVGIQRRKYEYEPIFMVLRKGYLHEDFEKEKIARACELKERKKNKRSRKHRKEEANVREKTEAEAKGQQDFS